MAERLIAHPWKGCIRASVSGVRIPLSPQNKERNAKALRDYVLREERGIRTESRQSPQAK